MPTTSNNSSPVKRPGLGRRAVSSHAVVTRSSSSSTQGELENSHISHHPHHKAPSHHRPHRAHLVGGGHRSHGRNPSFGKNLGKLQRHNTSQELRLHHHQRKKSAPVTPVASPPRQHIRWDGTVDDAFNRTSGSMKKNNSSPALRRSNSSVLPKKALVTDRPHTSSGKKKTVGFELGDSTDEGDWEDTTQSPESTRRSSVVQVANDENPAVLVDPLTFVKRPYPQFPRATSLPEATSKSFREGDQSSGEDGGDDQDDQDDEKVHTHLTKEQPSDTEEARPEELTRPTDHDIASRLLSPSHSAKAPPAMSSISATATPAPVDTISRNTSLTNLASGPDGVRRPLSANIAHSGTPTTPATGGSSSIEGGVSRFINSRIATSRTDSDSNTPSSFLPHYHPQTPPSPRSTGPKKSRGSPSSRQPGTEPHSRTQQKLWLQRTAALNTSPPDSHGASTSVSPSGIDPTYIGGTARTGPGPYDAGRALVNGSSRNGGPVHQNEAKHIRKTYEKAALELTVVRRFQSPTGDSFSRLDAILKDGKSDIYNQEPRSGLGKPIKSAPALVLLQKGTNKASQNGGSNAGSPDSRQLLGRKQAGSHSSVSQADIQDSEDPLHPSHRLLSTSDEAAHGSHGPEEHAEESHLPNESDMMIRRMWESREVATSG